MLSLPATVMFAQQPSELQPSDAARVTAGQFLRVDSARARGGLQRTSSFLGIHQPRPRVQIAFVLDGTESMSEEFEGLKANLDGFIKELQLVHAGKDTRVELALVVYRDTDAQSGPVVVPQTEFTADMSRFSDLLRQTQTETGEPYFNELVDQGLHAALTQLQWLTADENATRWIILFGDAPPYPEGADGYRRYSTDELVKLANRRAVSIYALLTNSRFAQPGPENERLQKVAKEKRPEAARFLGVLTDQTGGRLLDMWDQQQVSKWLDDATTITRPIRAIAHTEIRSSVELVSASQESPEAISVAILPHVPLDAMEYDPRNEAVQIATALRYKLSRVPGLEIKEGTEVARAFQELARAQAGQPDLLRELARRLRVRLLIWGDYKRDYDDQVSIVTRLYDGGQPIAEARASTLQSDSAGVRDLTQAVAGKLLMHVARPDNGTTQLPQTFLAVFRTADRSSEVLDQLSQPLAQSAVAQRALLAGLGYLELALAFSAEPDDRGTDGGSTSTDLLDRAVQELTAAVEQEPTNPLAHLLLASCYFNLARAHESGEARIRHQQHLKLAYEHRDSDPFSDDPVRLEIEADYALLVAKDVPAAVRRYEELTRVPQQSRGRFALRAHWMLAGIRLGDWGVTSYAPQLIDPEKARQHVLQILSNWPDSPEAEFYRKCMREGESEMDVPLERGILALNIS